MLLRKLFYIIASKTEQFPTRRGDCFGERTPPRNDIGIDKINRPSQFASGDWFDLRDGSICRASPNDTRIVVVVIIVIGEVEIVLHGGGIIA